MIVAMKIITSFIITFFLSLCLYAQRDDLQNAKPSTDSSKMAGAYIARLMDHADSLRHLTDSLTAKLNIADKMVYSSQESELARALWYLPLALLAFALILIGGILYFMYKLQKGFGNYAFQIVGLIIVVTASLFLIVTGYDKDQITPVIGLLGTIVGFIFGSNINSKTNNEDPTK
jgi:hypothetical protein